LDYLARKIEGVPSICLKNLAVDTFKLPKALVSSSLNLYKILKPAMSTLIKYSYLSRQIFLSPVDEVLEQITKSIIIQQASLTPFYQPLPSDSSVTPQHHNKTSNQYQIGIEAICAVLCWVESFVTLMFWSFRVKRRWSSSTLKLPLLPHILDHKTHTKFLY
jgi:hypothetical protein